MKVGKVRLNVTEKKYYQGEEYREELILVGQKPDENSGSIEILIRQENFGQIRLSKKMERRTFVLTVEVPVTTSEEDAKRVAESLIWEKAFEKQRSEGTLLLPVKTNEIEFKVRKKVLHAAALYQFGA